MTASFRRIIYLSLLTIAPMAAPLTANGANTSIPEVGAHTPLLRFEKNENPQNKMVVFTKLNEASCAFEANDSMPILDEYWLMDGTKYKRVHPMIKSSVQERLEVDKGEYEKSKKFLVHLKDFKELKSDLGSSPTFEVSAKKKGSACDARVEMTLGPSDKNRRIQIESIYADSSKTILPPFRKLQALTIHGKDVETGETVERKYLAN